MVEMSVRQSWNSESALESPETTTTPTGGPLIACGLQLVYVSISDSMANPSGFALLALPCAPSPELELDPDDPFEDCADPFLDAPKAVAPNIKTAHNKTSGLCRGPRTLSNLRMSNLQFVGGDLKSLDGARTT